MAMHFLVMLTWGSPNAMQCSSKCHSKEAAVIPACLYVNIAGGLLVILYEEVHQSVLSHESLLSYTCCCIHVCQDERYQSLRSSASVLYHFG